MMISNRISVQLEGYIKYKHSLGFHIEAETTVLRNFVRYTLERNYGGPLTKDIALDWICLRKDPSRKTKGRRLEAISPFAKYIVAFDNEAEMLPPKLFGNAHSRNIPYIYTESETRSLMEECRNLYSPDGLRSLTMSVAIGLLWSSGLRTSELTQLKIRDVDPTKNLLYIWNTKFKKDRIVPLSATTSEKLLEYSRRINDILGLRDEGESYFVTTGGKPLNSRGFEYAFTKIRECINAKPAGYPTVRLTDFRHTFACRTISNWLMDGEDVNARIFLLSTYMGHKNPQDTYWYLSATPEMLNLSCSHYEDMFGGGIHE